MTRLTLYVTLQAYRRSWKFYKIFQMAEKLVLLGVTLYIPASTSSWKRLTAATSIAFLAFIVVLFTHPLSDVLEAGLDVTSRFVWLLCPTHLLFLAPRYRYSSGGLCPAARVPILFIDV